MCVCSNNHKYSVFLFDKVILGLVSKLMMICSKNWLGAGNMSHKLTSLVSVTNLHIFIKSTNYRLFVVYLCAFWNALRSVKIRLRTISIASIDIFRSMDFFYIEDNMTSYEQGKSYKRSRKVSLVKSQSEDSRGNRFERRVWTNWILSKRIFEIFRFRLKIWDNEKNPF